MPPEEQRRHMFHEIPRESDVDESLLRMIADMVVPSPESVKDCMVYAGPCSFIISSRTGDKLKRCRELRSSQTAYTRLTNTF